MSALLRLHSRVLAAGLFLGAAACQKPVLKEPDLDALGALSAQVDSQRLMGTVQELVAEHLADSTVDCSPLLGEMFPLLCHISRNRSGALMQSRLEALGLKVQRQDTPGSDFPTSNIIADLPGVSRPEEIVLVAAHFDSYYSGADDNSTGVAAVLELARILSQHRFERTLRFVGFDLEELGKIGSGRYVPTLAGEQITMALIYDCIGYYSSAPGSQQSLPGLPSPQVGDFLAVVSNDDSSPRASEIYALNDALKLAKLVPLIAPGDGVTPISGNLLRSDHTPFWLTRKQALLLTDTANFRNPNYHKDTDTPDTLEPASFANTVRISAAALGYWAGGPR